MAKIATLTSKNGSSKTGASGAKRILNETAEIERLAYQFFVERGNEHGHDQEDWIRAERIIRSRNKN